MKIVIRFAFKDNNKFYPQIYLTNCTYNKVYSKGPLKC